MAKIPILVTAFNRADHVAEVMKVIRDYKPDRLYLECDGPRLNKSGECEAVDKTRQTMLDAIDWPCEVKTLFREKNLGCAHAMYGAITWFLQQEEFGIICEDDVVISQDFFLLCEDLIPRYAQEDSIMQISARNTSGRKDINNSYVYAQCFHCWGWATWRRAWAKMDMSMEATNRLSILYLVKRLGWFRGIMMHHYFKVAYKNLSTFNSWATRWFLSILDNDGKVIVPGVNLAVNIGTDGGAHYKSGDLDPYANLMIEKFKWPVVYNDSYEIDPKQFHYDNKDFFRIRMFGLKNKIRKLFHF